MSGSTLKIELTPESRRLLESVRKLGQKISLKNSMRQIGVSYRKEEKMIFDHQQPRGGGMRWKPLNARYAAQKARRWGNKPILQASGRLYKSMTSKTSDTINKVGHTSGEFGTKVPYAEYHDKGKGGMPYRNFSEPSNRTAKGWKKTIERDIEAQANRLGIKA